MRDVTEQELIAMGRSPRSIFTRMSAKKNDPWITAEIMKQRVGILLEQFVAPTVLDFQIDGRPIEEVVVIGIAEGGLYFQYAIANFLENKLNASLAGKRVVRTSWKTLRVRSTHSRVNQGKPELSGLPKDLGQIEGKLVIVADDIADTGATLEAVTARLREHKPAKILSIVCLCKPWTTFNPDYVAFRLPNDVIAVGWGMDAGMGVGRANNAIWNIASYLRRMNCRHLINPQMIKWAREIGNQDLLELAAETIPLSKSLAR